jgi:hypothetical protein
LKGRDDKGGFTNVQYEFNQNCHYESPLYNEYNLIKIKRHYLKNLFKKDSWSRERSSIGLLALLEGPTWSK